VEDRPAVRTGSKFDGKSNRTRASSQSNFGQCHPFQGTHSATRRSTYRQAAKK
jgi:hypothetical protein